MALPVINEAWNGLTAEEKIERFNAAGTTVDELRNAGVSQSDINWMLNNNYTPPEDKYTPEQYTNNGIDYNYLYTLAQTPVKSNDERQLDAIDAATVRSGVSDTSNTSNTSNISNTSNTSNTLAGTKITGSGGTKQLTLPEGWDNYNANQKISWFKNNNVLVSDLQAAGVSAADINWMLQNGYTETETGPSTGPSTETDATQRIENLANELGIPKFVVANLVNNGISDASIREKYRSTGTGTGTGTGPSTGTSTVKGGTGTGTGSLAGTKITGSGGTKQLTLPEGWDKYIFYFV